MWMVVYTYIDTFFRRFCNNIADNEQYMEKLLKALNRKLEKEY